MRCAISGLLLACLMGCGTTREKHATNQLLLSDAVDRAVAKIDFSPLRDETVFLDTTYIRQVKGTAFVNADYIISSIRQQMVLAGCLLQDDRQDADFVAEARVGALGTDGHDVNYGVPSNQGLSAAAALVSNSVPMSLPEVSLARRTDDHAASKIAVFAYHRESRTPVWQSGLAVARSSSQARWILGAGPFHSGSIHEGTRFAGGGLKPTSLNPRDDPEQVLTADDAAYRNPAVWSDQLQNKLFASPGPVRLANLPKPGEDDGDAVTTSESAESSD